MNQRQWNWDQQGMQRFLDRLVPCSGTCGLLMLPNNVDAVPKCDMCKLKDGELRQSRGNRSCARVLRPTRLP